MPNVTVLVTSAGVASAVNVMKSLRLQREIDVAIVATDADKFAAGLYLADYSYVSPIITDFERYLGFLLTTCKKHAVEALYPCYSKELALISAAKESFAAIGVQLLISSPETIGLCNDKVRMNEFASRLGMRVPKSYTDTDMKNITDADFPLFAKPLQGSSSIGAVKIENREDLDYFLSKVTKLFVQKFVPGHEVTIDVFCNQSGEPMVVAPRLRLATKAGQSVKGKTIDSALFRADVERLCRSIGMVGTCNIQFIMHEAGPTFLEINPRYAAGGLMLTVRAGANIPFLALKEMLGYEITASECKVKPDVYMSRYWEEVFWEYKGEQFFRLDERGI
jgi:carbamoyl-phosphate synthase large subunit